MKSNVGKIICHCLITFEFLRSPQKVFINHYLAIGMFQNSFLVVLLIIGVSTSLLTYSITSVYFVDPYFLNQAFAQQERGLEGQQEPDVGGSSAQCPANQHSVGPANECEWDNCGSATPPMYRNTQTGRCVSDCSEVGQFWVEQGNICVSGEASNRTSTQSPPPSSSSVPNQGAGNENVTVQTDAETERPLDNATSSGVISNMSSIPSTVSQTVDSLAGEPVLPYACFSNTFTCYCDGTQDCNSLTSSGECKAEVRTVEGKPGLGECDWNANS
jgi:hypothetical protein